MSTQQYSQFPNSYYGLEHYPYQQYMSGSQPQTGAQPQTQGQALQPVSQQQLQAQSAAQYAQQPYGQYYMVNNQVQPGQQQQQQPQQQQQQQQQQAGQQSLAQSSLTQSAAQTYSQYSQPQQAQNAAPQSQAADYSAHYPGYTSSASALAPYGQYAMYQQGVQPQVASGGNSAAASSTVPLASLYTGPAQLGTLQTPVPASSAGTNPTSQATGSSGPSVGQTPAATKASAQSETLSLPANSSVGQYQPPGIRPRVTTTMWEDEKTLCYQVDANNVSVVRRADNNMINGTKLLNVAQMTRGRRDGILKLEKIRHVVKIGSMHLKGVWIPFDRALAMAQRERIVDLLYPLFVRDIKKVIQTGVTPVALASVSAAAATTSAAKPSAATASGYPGAAASNAANANASYYQQYPSQYAPSASGSIGGLGEVAGSAAVPQQQQIAAQQQLYGYTQQPYYGQYYAYNQPASTAAASGSAGANYSSYAQPPMYSTYGAYLQGPQSGQPQKPYDQGQQPQQIQGHAQKASPALKEKKEDKK